MMTDSIQDVDAFIRLQKEKLGREQRYAANVSSFL